MTHCTSDCCATNKNTPCLSVSYLLIFHAGVRMPSERIKPWLDQIKRSTTGSWRGTTTSWKKLWDLSSTARYPSYTELCQLKLRKHNGNLRHTHAYAQRRTKWAHAAQRKKQKSNITPNLFTLQAIDSGCHKFKPFLMYCSLLYCGNFHHMSFVFIVFWLQICLHIRV